MVNGNGAAQGTFNSTDNVDGTEYSEVDNIAGYGQPRSSPQWVIALKNPLPEFGIEAQCRLVVLGFYVFERVFAQELPYLPVHKGCGICRRF